MTAMPLALLHRAMPLLPAARFEYLARTYLKIEGPDATMAQALHLALFEWFAQFKDWLSEDEIRRALEFHRDEFETLADPSLRRSALMVSDARYVALIYDVTPVRVFERCYDLQTDKESNLTDAEITHIACNVHALFSRLRKRIETLGGTDVAKHADGHDANGHG